MIEPEPIYEIKIEGQLHEKWGQWLNSSMMKIITSDDGTIHTTITVSVPDQAALRGLLNKIWDLNLTLISVALQEVQ